MTRPSARRAAAQANAAARRTAQNTPAVRGSDWRSATVATVNSDGTITTTDGIPARRDETYTSPTVGDLVYITRSGSGNWRATGRPAVGPGGWQPITLAANWGLSGSYYTPAYRIEVGGAASLCGLAVFSGSLSTGVTVGTVAAEATPQRQVRATVQVAIGYFGVITLAPTGVITLGDFSGTLPTTGNKYAEFDALSHYRLI